VFTCVNKSIKKYDWKDIASIKLSVIFFTLMIAKLWPGLLGLNWYLYLIFAIVFMIVPLRKLHK